MDATDLDDPYLTCPYERSHRILKSRMQWHLVRCRKNHPCDHSQKKQCPYDATHVINEQEFPYHVENCVKSGIVVNYLQTKEPQRSLGAVSLQEIANTYIPPCSENWDDDPPEKTYDAIKEAKSKGVSIPEVGLSKAKKRHFIQSERMRIRALEDEGVIFNPTPRNYKEVIEEEPSEVVEEVQTPLRAPRTKPIAASICSNTDYMEETLNSTRNLDSTRSEVKGPTSSTLIGSQTDTESVFNAIIAEAGKLTLSQASDYSINGFNPSTNGVNVNDIGNILDNLHISSTFSSSSTLHNLDVNSEGKSSLLSNIDQIQSQLNAVKSVEESLNQEKAKLREIVENLIPRNDNIANLSRNSRCAANFSNNFE